MTGTAQGGVEVVRAGAEHLEALAEFYRHVWDPGATAETVAAGRDAAAAANPVSPGEPPPTWIVLRNGRAIGHVTTIPIRAWIRGDEHSAHWVKGLWVLPEFQRSAAGFLVLKEAVRSLPSALALVHEPAARRLFEALGFTDYGSLPNALRVLRAGAVLGRLDLDALGLGGLPGWMRTGVKTGRPLAPTLGPLADGAAALWATLAAGRAGGYAIEVTADLDREGADRLWATVRWDLAAAPRRGAADLIGRYQANLGYRFVHVRTGSRLEAVAVVRQPGEAADARLKGIRIATLSDLLYPPGHPKAGLAALRGAERAARAVSADAVLCSASAGAVASLLWRRGYLRLPANLHVLGRFPEAVHAPSSIADWWFTRGDSGGDGVF